MKTVFLILLLLVSCASTIISKDAHYVDIEGLNPANISEDRLSSDLEFKQDYEACISWWVVFKHLQPFVCKIGKACFTGDKDEMKEMPMWWCWAQYDKYFKGAKDYEI